MGTQREAWTKVFWGTVTALVGIVGFALIVGGGLFVAVESSRVTVTRTDWSGVWIHDRDGDPSILRMFADGGLAFSNVDEWLIGPNRTPVFNGCWDPETESYPGDDASVSIMLHGYDSFSHVTELHVRDDNTLYLAEGLERFEYERYTGDVTGLEIPELQPDLESCDAGYWEDW